MAANLPKLEDYIPEYVRPYYRGSKPTKAQKEKRRAERISLSELNENTSASVQKYGKSLSEMHQKDDRPLWLKAVDVLDLPRNVIANAVGSIVGIDKSDNEKATFGLRRVGMSEILDKLGVNNRAAKGILGFVGDVAIDPLTYLTLGGSAGTKAAKHLPSLLGKGAKGVTLASRGRGLTDDLARAIGKNADEIQSLYNATKAAKGANAAKKATQKEILDSLAKRASEGAPEALEYFSKHGAKGRKLARLPFTDIGPTLKRGAEARKYKAVQEGLTDAGQEAFGRLRTLSGRAKKVKDAARLVEGAGGEAAREKNLLRRITSEINRFTSSPEAPGVIRQLQVAKRGQDVMPGAPGVVNRLREVKRVAFGPGASEMAQRGVGAQARYNMRSAATQAAKQAEMGERVRGVVRQLMDDPKVRSVYQKADDLAKDLYDAADARGIENVTDAASESIQRLQAAGALDTTPVRGLMDDIGRAAGDVQAEIAKTGLYGGGDVEGYLPRVLTEEADRAIRAQNRRGFAKPGAQYPRRMSTPRPEAISRTKALTYSKGDDTVKVLSTSDDKINDLVSKGYELTEETPVTAAEMNRLAREGKLERLLGPGFKGDLFERDIGKAYGLMWGRSERTKAVKDLADIVSEYGVDVPRSRVGSGRYSHLVKPNRPGPDNPFQTLEKAGVFERAYPPNVAEVINRATEVWNSEPAINSLLRASDVTLGFWKRFTLMHPSYVARNVWQNFFGGLMAGANPVDVARIGFGNKKARALRNALVQNTSGPIRGMTMQISGKDIPMEELFEAGRQLNMTGAGQTVQQIPTSTLNPSLSQKAAGAASKGGQGVLNSVYRGNAFIEDMQRLGTWLHFMDKGLEPNAAAVKTVLAMPDLSDLTMWEKQVMKRIFPWYAWMRKNGALQLFHYLPQKPAYANTLPKLQNLVEGMVPGGTVPKELRPDWMREQGAMQITGDKEGGSVFLPQTWLPFEDLYSVLALPISPGDAARRGVSSLRPGARALFEFGTGFDPFKGQAYETGPEATTGEYLRRLPSSIIGRSASPMDTLASIRPLREAARVAEMPTVGTKIQRGFLGGAIQPLDSSYGRRNLSYELREEAREVRKQINEARAANDLALAERLQVKWAAIMARLQELGGKGVPKSTQEVLRKLPQNQAITYGTNP